MRMWEKSEAGLVPQEENKFRLTSKWFCIVHMEVRVGKMKPIKVNEQVKKYPILLSFFFPSFFVYVLLSIWIHAVVWWLTGWRSSVRFVLSFVWTSRNPKSYPELDAKPFSTTVAIVE